MALVVSALGNGVLEAVVITLAAQIKADRFGAVHAPVPPADDGAHAARHAIAPNPEGTTMSHGTQDANCNDSQRNRRTPESHP